ncbi:MAG: hypothetical protein SFT91_02310 [Rickettsiaceae bacterium]|nr:hypothetical protein [Rickettsiaceae bacterium]
MFSDFVDRIWHNYQSDEERLFQSSPNEIKYENPRERRANIASQEQEVERVHPLTPELTPEVSGQLQQQGAGKGA